MGHTTPTDLFFASSGSRHLLHDTIAISTALRDHAVMLGLHLASHIEEGRMPLDFDLLNSQALQQHAAEPPETRRLHSIPQLRDKTEQPASMLHAVSSLSFYITLLA